MNIRDKILAADDLALKKVPVKAWGVDVYLKDFSLDEQSVFEALLKDEDDSTMVSDILVMGVFNKNGEPVFTDEDVAALRKKNAVVIYDLFKQIVRHNSPEDEDTSKKN